jgi:predicted hotdog family 3-hydroxylacyl-ACP dehydratase
VNRTLDIALADTWFEGHFPGHPILPGVTQLTLVVEALARERGAPTALGGIAFVRLRQLVRPGERLRLATDVRANDTLRVALTREGTPVMNGELRFGLPTADRPAADALPGLADAPPVDVLLPHKPPMRFVTGVLGEAADGLVCSAQVPSNCPLVAGGVAPALAAIEAAAQTCALWEAMRRWRDGPGAGPRTGYLVGLHHVSLFAAEVPADTMLTVTVKLDALASPLAHYAMQVDMGGRCLLHGTLATFIAC